MSHKVEFVIAGQPKSGTTALAEFLSEHPQICMSMPKEPGYFATDIIKESDKFHGKPVHFPVRTEEEYENAFKHRKTGQLAGEASTMYAYSSKAAENIAKHNPNCKIIIILRNPVDFVHSMHWHMVNTGTENEKSFSKALELEALRKEGESLPSTSRVRSPSLFYYKNRGLYYSQLKRFFDHFSKDQILVLTHEEFKKDNAKSYKKVLDFLDVDASFMPSFKNVNANKTSRNQMLTNLIYSPKIKDAAHKILPKKLYKTAYETVHKLIYKKTKKEPIDEDLRKELYKFFSKDITRTGKLIGRNLHTEWGVRE